MVETPNAIELTNVTLRYAGVLALSNVSLAIPRGEFIAILGPNGAGKSTIAQLMTGMLRPSAGTVAIDGQVRQTAERSFISLGVALVPERRRLFGQLTVGENLTLGGYGAGKPRAELRRRFDEVMALMPKSVQDGRDRAAVTLSGGEQQMLAIGRALMASPRTIVIDEPSLGLAPIMTDRVYDLLGQMHADGVTVVVIEQIATHAVSYASRMAVLDRGIFIHVGAMSDAASEEALKVGYLGHG